MMNFVQQQEDLYDFDDQSLANELQSGMRGYHPMVVAAEIQRRLKERSEAKQQMMAQQAQQSQPVAERQLMEFMAQAQPAEVTPEMMPPEMAMQGGMEGMPPEMMAAMPAAMPPEMPAEAPVGIAAGMPQQMSGGGIVRRAQRGMSVEERNKRIFLQNFYPEALRISNQLNVPVEGILAQAAIESGWGKKYKGGNIFGIKADPSWKGSTIDFTTQEVRDGQRGYETGTFRKYPTITEAFEDYGMFLSENPRYKDVLGTGQDIDLFAQRMGASGYATDPEYGTKVANIAQNIRELNKDLGLGGQPRTVSQEAPSFLERLFPKTAKVAEEERKGLERFKGAQTAEERGAAVAAGVAGLLSTAATGVKEATLENPVARFIAGAAGLAPLKSDLQEVEVTGKRDIAKQRELENLSELYKGVTVQSQKKKEPGIEEELLASLRTARGTSAQRAERLKRAKEAEIYLGLGELIASSPTMREIGAGLPGVARRVRGVSERADEENLKNLMAQYAIAKDIEKSNLSFETLQIEKMKAQAALAKAISGGGSEQEITNLKNLLEAIAKAEEGMYGENKEVYESIFQRLQGIAGVGGPQGITSSESIRQLYGRG